MADKKYRLVGGNVEELDEKIRRHRRMVLSITAIAIAVVLIILTGIFLYFQMKTYDSYQVTESLEREDSPGTSFAGFHGNIIKYSNDGAFYIDQSNHLIWNQTYEMQDPMIDICEGYVAIADKQGKQIYIMDTSGPCGQISTNLPIQQVHVANQGTVAVLMVEDGTGYIHLYDKEGGFLAEGELHTKNSGYPLDLSLSNDGRKMAVSMLDVNEGAVQTTVSFYNFGSVGQNEIDNIVGSYSYPNMVIPKVEFLNNDTLVAYGDSKLILYEGSQKPEVKKEIELEQEIRSIFFNENYFGLVFNNENKDETYGAVVYDLKGSQSLTFDFSMEYDEIGFLDNNEICIRNNLECEIYSLRGVLKFHYNFDKNIWKIFSLGRGGYMFIMEDATEKVILK